MIDIYGREWMEQEYLELYNQGLIQESDVVKALGINRGRCERCLNTSNDWLGRFNYKGEIKPVRPAVEACGVPTGPPWNSQEGNFLTTIYY